MNRKVLSILVALSVLGVGGLAIWLTGFNLTGSFTAVSGEKPSVQTESWDINIASSTDLEGNNSFIYTNDDGSRSVTFELIDNIISSDPGCNYEDQDLTWYIDVNSAGETEIDSDLPYTTTMNSGSNSIAIRYILHPNHCGLTGDYGIAFTI